MYRAFIHVSSRSTDPKAFLFGMIVVVVFILIAAYFSRKYVIRRRLNRVQLFSLSDFKSGTYRKIVGKVYFGGETMRAPISGRECVYYYLKISERSGRNTSTIVSDEFIADLILTDGKNYALIDADSPKSYLVPDRNYESGSFTSATERMEQILREYKIDPTTSWGADRHFEYEEGILEKNEECIISGIGTWEKSTSHNVKVPSARILVIRKQVDKEMFISDDPGTIEQQKVL